MVCGVWCVVGGGWWVVGGGWWVVGGIVDKSYDLDVVATVC